MFDFWYEFKTVVPKGYTRFLGKLSELTDLGVEVHFFIGNHDIWCGDYLEKECGVTLHREALTTEICGKEFYLAHGDGLGDPDDACCSTAARCNACSPPCIHAGAWHWASTGPSTAV